MDDEERSILLRVDERTSHIVDSLNRFDDRLDRQQEKINRNQSVSERNKSRIEIAYWGGATVLTALVAYLTGLLPF